MITLEALTKIYGTTTAVDGLSFEVAPGKVTGFLGPNGAGKTTTMRVILGLDAPTSGQALVNGRLYAALGSPLREVGALLDARALHPRRSARAHLVAMARSNRIAARRVDEVLETVGLSAVARKPAGQFSLGMAQRLGIAGALLGDPGVLMFDEPINGLDPDGVRWVRSLMRALAAEGRTVFVSSHLMSEMQQTADHLIVVGRGRLLADAPIAEVIASSSLTAVVLRVPDEADRAHMRDLLSREAASVSSAGVELAVSGVSADRVGDLAHEHGVRLHELRTQDASLEEAYMQLTDGSVEYYAGTAGGDRVEVGATG
jgi:ABC-2 type transport system ATP-binding protein